MSDISLRPRSSTELVDAAFQVYRRDPLQFITGLALIYVPWLVIAAAAGLVRTSDNAQLFPGLGWALGSLVTYTLAGGVMTILASDVYFGRPADIATAFRTVFSRFGAVFGGMFSAGIFIFIGLLLFIVPGVYAYGRFFAVKQAVLLEHIGPMRALSRSSELTRGLKRHVVNTMGLILLVNIAIALGVLLATSMIPGQILRLLVSTCVSVTVYPLVGITETLLYYDVRIRREGFDIEYLAGIAPPTPASDPGQQAAT
jgi:hypothetical protein